MMISGNGKGKCRGWMKASERRTREAFFLKTLVVQRIWRRTSLVIRAIIVTGVFAGNILARRREGKRWELNRILQHERLAGSTVWALFSLRQDGDGYLSGSDETCLESELFRTAIHAAGAKSPPTRTQRGRERRPVDVG